MKIILFSMLAFLCICGHSIAESALMIRNDFGDYYLYEYNLESTEWKSYNTAFTEPFLIQGRIDDRPLIADYVSESDRIDLYGYEGEGYCSLVVSAGNTDLDDIDYVFAYYDGWIYVVSEDDMILRIKDGTIQELAHAANGWMTSDMCVEFPVVSPSGRIAFWNEIDETVGLSIIYVEDDVVTTDFIPAYGHSLGASRIGYFAPMPPMIWLNDTKLLGFLVRQDAESDVYSTDAVCIDVDSHSYSQYLDVNGTPVYFQNYQLSGHPSLTADGKNILLIAGDPPGRYWTKFEYAPNEKWLSQFSLETGELVHLTELPDDQTTMRIHSIISAN